MSDTEQPTTTEQPEEQPAPAEDQPASESQPEQPPPAPEPEPEQPSADVEETTQPTEEPPAEPEAKPEETPATEEETQPSTEEVEPKPEEGEVEPAPPAEGEGEAEEKEEEKEEEIKEEPVVITPEGSPFWLPTEEVLAKGLPESEVENFKNFYFKQTHSLHAWYDKLKDVALQTEFITLSKEEIDALSAEGDVSEEQQQVLTGLEDRVNQAIELFEEDGALVRVNGRGAKDAILERNEEAFIAEVRDAVVNELEVAKQRANAYAIWKEQERPPNAFKRGLNSIRQSFRKGRVHSTTKKEEKPKLEEEEKKEEEPKPAETEVTETPAPAEGEEGGQATGGAEVTIQVEVEGGDSEDKPAETPAETPAEETPAETPAEQPAEEQPVTEEAPKKDDEDVEEAPKKEDAAEGEGEPKKEDEIETVEEPKEEPKKTPEHVHHKLCKAKAETLPNQIVKAFITSTTVLLRVKSGKEAIDILRRSVQIRNDLNQLKAFGGIEGVQVSLSVSRWQEQLPSYPGMELRGFVYKNELNALSQYYDTAYYPNVDIYHNTIQAKVQDFFKNNIQEHLNELENYIIDFYVTPEKVLVVRLNPFYTAIGACLFTWTENGKVLTQGPFEFRIVEAPKVAPEAFSSFQPFWQTMLDSVLQQRQPQRPQRSCVLL